MNYENHYNKLIERAKTREIEGYVEKHHIIPRCMGGDDSEENLVKLTAREHFIAHQLLVKIYPNVYGLIVSCVLMGTDAHGNRITNKVYGWIRTQLSISLSKNRTGQNKQNSERVKRQAKTWSKKITGLNKENCEWRRKQAKHLSVIKTGQNKTNNKSVLQMSEKLNMLSIEQRILFAKMKKAGMQYNMILNYFKINFNITMSYRNAIRIFKKYENLI